VITVVKFHNRNKQKLPDTARQNQNWITFVLAGFVIVWLLDISFQTMRTVFGTSPYLLLKIIYPIIFLLIIIIMIKGLNNPMIFVNASPLFRRKYLGSNLQDYEKKLIYKNILLAMDQKKLYRNPSLSVNDLANELSVLPKHLSQVINESFNKNFFDLVNDYRIGDAKAQLAESADTRKTVLEILYDLGFNSKSSFNKAFRKSTGITPTEYRRMVYSKSA
jgi:AraC-like DNA-binding protein